jgi:Xaa-Pro aminopeptidase
MPDTNPRITRLQQQMAAAEVELVALGPTANMRYLLGFTPHADERPCLLLITSGDAQMVVPTLNADQVAAHTDLPLQRWADEDGPNMALRRALGSRRNVPHLAIDGAMRADFLLPLMAETEPDQLLTVEDLLAPLRLRKSPEELEKLARAAAQADRAMVAGMAACRPGATEAEVAWAVESAFRQDGAEQVDFAIVASGPNAAFPHHHPGDRRMQAGDAVILDIGATLDGYKSDITRMICLGRPSAELQTAYGAVLAANEAGRAAVRPGVSAGEVDRTARAVLERAGYGPYFTHRTGHGLGLEVHEGPWIAAGNPMCLEEGMVFSVEPGVYLPGKFGIRIEDIVAVGPTGPQLLTGFDHTLVVKADSPAQFPS